MAERLIIVDDDESLLDLCATAFKLAGYDVVPCESGARGLKALEAGGADLMLVDLIMPGLDGLQVLKQVREKHPNVEVVIMTATPTLKSAIEGLRLGACDYVMKPFEVEHLTTVVRRALDHRRTRRELEGERALRQELETAYQELQKVERLKESLLARVSHELRTPLSELTGSLDLLQEAVPESDARMSRLTSTARKGLKRMERTLQNLLDFVDLQGVEPLRDGEPVALEPLIREQAAHLTALAEKRKVTVEFSFEPGLPPVKADAAALAKAVGHFLHNAIVFNKEGGKATVRGRCKEGVVELEFQDTGEGIPEGQFDRIFDSFYQVAEYLTRRVDGLGLGLAIARRIVEAHGGQVAIRSKVGEGSTFVIRLPTS